MRNFITINYCSTIPIDFTVATTTTVQHTPGSVVDVLFDVDCRMCYKYSKKYKEPLPVVEYTCCQLGWGSQTHLPCKGDHLHHPCDRVESIQMIRRVFLHVLVAGIIGRKRVHLIAFKRQSSIFQIRSHVYQPHFNGKRPWVCRLQRPWGRTCTSTSSTVSFAATVTSTT